MEDPAAATPARAPSVLRLLSGAAPLVLGGLALGLRVARAGGGPVAVGLTVVGTLGAIGSVLVAADWYSRRRRAQQERAHRGAKAIASGLLVSTAGNGRARALGATIVLLTDRLLVDLGRRSERGPLELPFSAMAQVQWSTAVIGARVVLLLRITPSLGIGAPILLRLDPRRQDVAAFVDDLQDAFERWLPGRAPVPPRPAVAASRRSGRLLLGAVGCALVLAITGGWTAGTRIGHRGGTTAMDPDHEVTGAPGYYTFSGPEHLPITVGAPWGTRCKPVVVQVDPSVPAAAYAALAAVVREGRAAGIDITVADRMGRYRLADLYNTGGTPAAAQVVIVRSAVPQQQLTGHDSIGWNATPAPDGAHEYVTALVEDLNLPMLHSTADFRRAAEHLVGYSQGIATSSTRGSAFAADFAQGATHFTGEDLRAMLLMSGCVGVPAGS